MIKKSSTSSTEGMAGHLECQPQQPTTISKSHPPLYRTQCWITSLSLNKSFSSTCVIRYPGLHRGLDGRVQYKSQTVSKNSPATLRETGSRMRTPSSKPTFGQDLVEAMRLILAHHRGEIELEHVLPKARVSKATPEQRLPRAT